MKKYTFFIFPAILLLLVSVATVQAHWDPADGHKMHYPQTADPHGWDVCMQRIVIADDFECSETGAITDIHFWISFKNDIVDEVFGWDIAICEDSDSGPGHVLWKLGEANIDIREEAPSWQGWLCPYNDGIESNEIQPNNHQWYAQINITNISEPFEQQEGKVYWLLIHTPVAIDDVASVQPRVGWKTTPQNSRWRSPAVWNTWPYSSQIWRPVISENGVEHDMAFVLNGISIPAMDFGDTDETKCDDTNVKCNSYPTTLARNGARHIIDSGVFLGNPLTDTVHIDAEEDGQPTPDADGDDLADFDDEDGVFLPDYLVPGTTEQVQVLVSTDGFLDAWIDFNTDGDWDDRGERIFYSKRVEAGNNLLEFHVPYPHADHAPLETYARFRFSTCGNLRYAGLARDGEVEDYLVIIQNEPQPALDFGDVPEYRCEDDPAGRCNSYPTTLARNGARHKLVRGVFLGRYIDAEDDGQPRDNADGDDLSALDDEDGVFFANHITPDNTIEIKVIASMEGFINAWVDFNVDGDWDDAPERIFVNQPVKPGVNYLYFAVPPISSVAVDVETYTRFRYTTYELANSFAPAYAGLAEDGEVEDYLIRIEHPQCEFDFGDAPDLTVLHTHAHPFNYPTRREDNGARHLVNSGVYLGSPFTDVVHIDSEPDGLPSLTADGDDLDQFDDEDGVEFVSRIVPEMTAYVDVQVSVKGHLDAWIDFNADGDWDDFGEQIYASEPVVAGVNHLKFRVPPYPYAVPVNIGTYARFRFSLAGGLRYLGPARSGEVEDYHVRVEEPPRKADLGDAPDSSNSFGDQMTAYTSQGPLPVIVPARYPTVYREGSPPNGPIHWNASAAAYLGARVSIEYEADYGFDEDPLNNLIPPLDRSDLDKADDGVRVPLVLPSCRKSSFSYVVSVVRPVEELYVNVWFDWNRDGDWDDTLPCSSANSLDSECPIAREWAVRNQLLADLCHGIHKIKTPPFLPWHPWNANEFAGPIWMRITLAEKPWPPVTVASVNGWGGAGPRDGYRIGETEDYFFIPILHRIEKADLNCDNFVDLTDLALLVDKWLKTP